MLFNPTLDRFPAGVGVAGPSPNTLDDVLALSGLVDPKEPLLPPAAVAFCSRGLMFDGDGEYEYGDCPGANLDGEMLLLWLLLLLLPNRGEEYWPGLGLARLESGELA